MPDSFPLELIAKIAKRGWALFPRQGKVLDLTINRKRLTPATFIDVAELPAGISSDAASTQDGSTIQRNNGGNLNA
jgi:hypothetical protein